MLNLVEPIERLLTRREAEIAGLVAAGLSNKQIARNAGLSVATVKIHLHNAYKKLGIANRSMLAVMVSSDAGRSRNDASEILMAHERQLEALGASMLRHRANH